MHAQLGRNDHQGVGDVVAGIAEEGQLPASHVTELLAGGHDIGQHLSGMEGVGQAVPDGNAGILGQILNHRLLEAAVLDTVEHAAQNLGGVLQGLLLAHLGRTGIQEGDAHAQIASADFESAAGSGGGLLEQQNDLLVAQPLVLNAVVLHSLELGRQVEQIVDLVGGEIQQGQEASSSNVQSHVFFLLLFCWDY